MIYENLFDTEAKAKAFDLLAAKYYDKNFGTMSKTDLDTLMFSIFMDQVLEVHTDEDLMKFSDYSMSKALGITQSKVSVLKEKKQLQYPVEYDWMLAFRRLLKNARYEGKNIKIQIPDINLYIEIKQAIEERGGYVDMSYSKNLISVSPHNFFDLLSYTFEEEEKNKFIENLKISVAKYSADVSIIESQPLSFQLKDFTIDALKVILKESVGFGVAPMLISLLNI